MHSFSAVTYPLTYFRFNFKEILTIRTTETKIKSRKFSFKNLYGVYVTKINSVSTLQGVPSSAVGHAVHEAGIFVHLALSCLLVGCPTKFSVNLGSFSEIGSVTKDYSGHSKYDNFCLIRL